MLKNLLKKLTKNTPLDQAYKEFDSIRILEDKRFELQKKYGIVNEDIQVQKEIIDNNFLTLARVFSGLIKPSLENEYFSIQGTKPIIFKTGTDNEVPTEFKHTRSKTESKTKILQTLANIRSSSIKLERKFQELPLGCKIKSSARSKIETIATKKINNKIIAFCDLFKGNEQTVRDFIFRNMNEPDEDYHNIYSVIQRLDFMGFMLDNQLIDIKDAESLNISNKDIILIAMDAHDIHRKMNIVEFLGEFKTHKYDFLLVTDKNQDGSPIPPKMRFMTY